MPQYKPGYIAAFIDNVNIRGRIIEYLITSESEDQTRLMLLDALENEKTLPKFITPDKLGDYTRDFESFFTETDFPIISKIVNASPFNT